MDAGGGTCLRRRHPIALHPVVSSPGRRRGKTKGSARMDRNSLIIVIVAVIVVAAAAALIAYTVYRNKKRSQHLKGRFGPEYERLVAETGSARRAEAQLANRE